ncbi:GGDEF domain-containing protein [Neobacillus citreus]|uniref:GGDEF domain-containing protein n=1 Tax=Neobacillus citreus TaxID=2833578 RepID=A0A942T195_9BACI|nr:GGDEF domain-containing protein [Neobacillus citreus]MCH6266586.1 GGDEF domain-containing protein [Neobacillus citreus]
MSIFGVGEERGIYKEVRRKKILWSIIIIFTILPIVIAFNLKEELQRLSSFFWSLFLIPNIVIMILYPKWKVIVGTALFFVFFKYATHFIEEQSFNNIETVALILESFVDAAILFTVSYFVLRHNKLLKHMEKLTIVDSLTGLYNRRYFDLSMEKTIPFSQRINCPLSLIMIDIDHFKNINDKYGHLCGDEALKHIADIIKRNVRTSDAYVRFGGEEFAIILPNTDLGECKILAEHLRKDVNQSDFTYHQAHIPISISLGISLFKGENVEGFIEKADKALYTAKENGRNQVVMFRD